MLLLCQSENKIKWKYFLYGTQIRELESLLPINHLNLIWLYQFWYSCLSIYLVFNRNRNEVAGNLYFWNSPNPNIILFYLL